jgi:IclR helix-turn-helix domain
MPPPPAIAPSATQQLLHALAERPDASAAELADAAGIGRSTASKLLATLFAQGRVLRRSSGQQGGRRIPDRWTLPTITATTRETTTVAPALPATPTPQAADVDQPRPAPGRLGSWPTPGSGRGVPGPAAGPAAIGHRGRQDAGPVGGRGR